jgi:hypothetical protein
MRPTADIEVVHGPSPTVMLRAEPYTAGADAQSPPVRRALTIKLSTFWRRFAHPDSARRFAALAPAVWELQPHTVPWWTGADRARPPGTPDARIIWQWAAFAPSEWEPPADPRRFFEDPSRGREHQSA